MSQPQIIKEAESVIELLISQCADLESLLVIARRETSAVETGNFEELLRIVEERATFEEKLEVFQRQIENLRENMGYKFDMMMKNSIAERAAFLITQIQTQDERTLPLLLSSRNEASEDLQTSNRSQKSINAYSQEHTKSSVAYDTLF
jgi:flagellar biosynthesis/type III secretory pathway chaperone